MSGMSGWVMNLPILSSLSLGAGNVLERVSINGNGTRLPIFSFSASYNLFIDDFLLSWSTIFAKMCNETTFPERNIQR